MKRDYIYHESTTSICNECLKPIPAKIIFQDEKIYLVKNCSKHKEQKEIIGTDINFYKNRRNYDAPGTVIKTQTEVKNGCPYDCGLCSSHDQHSCISLIEITSKCNLDCSVCYAKPHKQKDLSIEKINEMLDFVQKVESNSAEVLQISGGEPTLHNDIIEVIKLARTKNFRYVMLNTNGIRIAEDIDFVKELSQFVGGFEIYLQFDGFDDENIKKIRGRSLLEIKEQALKNLEKYKIPTTLVMTVENGVNDNEIGPVIAFGINNSVVRGINLQPVAFYSNSAENRDHRSTLTEIIGKIETQTKKMLVKEDFIPLPCNVERVALTYLYKNGNKFIPITRSSMIEKYVPYINNTFMFTIEEALNEAKDIDFGCCNILDFLKDFRKFVPKDFMKWDLEKRTEYVSNNTFRISITSFIDKYNFDLKSMQKECVHIITEDLKRIPFSSYNMIYRGKDEN